MSTEYVFVNRDNVIDLLLKADGTAQDLSSITKIVAKIGDVTISDSSPTSWPIKWSGLEVTGKIQLKLGDQGLTANSYENMYLILYDAVNTNGIVWGSIPVRVGDV